MLPFTIELTIAALLIGIVVGVPLGVVAARRRDGLADWVARIVSLAGLSFPAFVSGILMLLVFAIHFHWFPVISRGWPLTDPVERLRSLALPALNLGLIMVAYVTRVTRSGMLKAMSEDYVRTARAKGVPARLVVWRHGFRNVLIPIVTVIGLYFGVLIGNSVLTEIVFNRPGLGKLIIGALEKRDYTMLQGLMVIYAFIIVLVESRDRPRLRSRRSAGEDRMSRRAAPKANTACEARRDCCERSSRGCRAALECLLGARRVPARSSSASPWSRAMIAAALLAPWISPHDPNEQNIVDKLASPSATYWLGADYLRPRRASRASCGAPASRCSSAFFSTAIGVGIGVAIGIVSGYFGGAVDRWISGANDVLMSFPQVIMGHRSWSRCWGRA